MGQKIKRTDTHSSFIFSLNLLQFLDCFHSSFADVVLDREFGDRLSSLKIGEDLILDMIGEWWRRSERRVAGVRL